MLLFFKSRLSVKLIMSVRCERKKIHQLHLNSALRLDKHDTSSKDFFLSLFELVNVLT